MNPYQNYKLALKPLSPLITPLQSDTLFGHISWAVYYLWGISRLSAFFDLYDEKIPPLFISDGFPAGYLPIPLLKPLIRTNVTSELGEIAKKENIELNSNLLTQLLKDLKKQKFLSISQFNKIQPNCNSVQLLHVQVTDLICEFKLNNKITNKEQFLSTAVTHNSVNRVLGKVTKGLYQQTERYYEPGFSYNVFLRTNFFSQSELQQIFDFITYSGYGRDKSTGKGKFAYEIETGLPFDLLTTGNAFMTLSHYIPDKLAPQKGYYRFNTKFGRLGGHFANSVIPGIESEYGGQIPVNPHPYKKPLLMMTPGSIFVGNPDRNYGLLLGGKKAQDNLWVHKSPIIRHYAMAFPLGIHVNEEEFDDENE